MMAVRRQATWFALVVAAGAISAFAQLNPTVKVLPKAQTPVPPECAEGLVAAPPRVVAEAQPIEPKRAPAPPSIDLKTRLRAVQVAAEQNDRETFKAALADARSAVASYPRGGERDAANDVIGVDSDLERLWDYSFTAASGAFFDNTTDFVTLMRRYPDYPKFIADSTLSAGGQTIYPTRETRQFMTAEAARRLARLGVRTPTRVTEEVVAPPPPKPKPQPKTARTTPPVTRKPAAVTSKPAHRKPTTKIARATTTPPQPRRTEPAPKTVPKPVPTPRVAPTPQPTPAPAPRVAPTPQPKPAPMPPPMPSPTPSPVPLSVPPPTPAPVPKPTPLPVPAPTPAPAPAPQPTTTTASATTETTATFAPAVTPTATAAPPPAQPAAGGRMNLLLAIILIIVGIGVLIVLFRASD